MEIQNGPQIVEGEECKGHYKIDRGPTSVYENFVDRNHSTFPRDNTLPFFGCCVSPLPERYVNVSVTVRVLSLLLFHLYPNIFVSDPISSVMMPKSTYIALTCDLQNHIFSMN